MLLSPSNLWITVVTILLPNLCLVYGKIGKPWSPSVCSSHPLFTSTLAPNYTTPYTFYPRNEDHLKSIQSIDISTPCRKTLNNFYKAYKSQSVWAYQLLDSCGQPSSGVLSGNTFYWGAYDQCLNVNPDKYGINFTGTFWRNIVSCTGIKYNGSRITTSLWDQRVVEICAPSTCNEQDISTILIGNSSLKVVEAVKIESYYDLPFDWSEKFIIVCFTLLGLIVIASTLSDFYLMPYEKIIEAKCNYNGTLGNLIASSVYCFSLRRNFSIVLSNKSSKYEISCLNGWRTLSIIIVILGHVCMVAAVFNSVNRENFDTFVASRWFQIIGNGSIWTDTFFVLSGFLIAHSSVRRISASPSSDDLWTRISAFSRELIHSCVLRYFRLTPTLVWMIMVYIMARRLGDGPHWDFLVQSLHTSIYRDMWKSLTYTINLFGVAVNPITGLVATWFLAADFQFFIASSLTLALINGGKPMIGWCLNGCIMMASILTTAWLTYTYNYPPVLLFDRLCEDEYFQVIYVKPWTRISAYCIGIFLHEVWAKYRNVNLSKSVSNSLLLISFSGMSLVIISSRKYYADEDESKLEKVIYGSLHRPLWSICVSYLIFHAASGNSNGITVSLSWSGFRIFAKLAYQAFYWHIFIIYYILGYYRSPVYADTLSYAILIIATLFASFALSIFSAMIFEFPFLHLLAIYRHNGIPELPDNNIKSLENQSTDEDSFDSTSKEKTN
ncbi:O-acyltransferase like protein [Tetranychus urticae]|uniref:Nose resistant-to-fluoxetine protein N-terminal domain-containing protein n=1 Tax=Tetranychus urticae TaxID=32264 RepID=T1JSE2_TETUR|nr:O-acyltransferase like protein [Tetranychus urticae]